MDHGLPDWQPRTGDIVIAYHLYNEPDDAARTLKRRRDGQVSSLATRKEEIAKFRPCVVIAAKDGKGMLVPISSSRHQRGECVEISDSGELSSFGFAPHKPAYAGVTGIAQYEAGSPLVHPVPGPDGTPSWTVGRASPELVAGCKKAFAKEHAKGRLKTIPRRFAPLLDPIVLDEMRRTADEARAAYTPRSARSHPSPNAHGLSDDERRRRHDALKASREEKARAVREMAARKADRLAADRPAPARSQETTQID